MSRGQRTPLRIQGALYGQIHYIDRGADRSDPATYTVPLQLSRVLTSHELRAMDLLPHPNVQPDGDRLLILNTTEKTPMDLEEDFAAFIAKVESRGAELEAAGVSARLNLARAYHAERERLAKLTDELRADEAASNHRWPMP